ncbi:MAG TPA: hypothetical protein VK995_06145, partial [Oceanipulchritudo sp.]|nr:hypothetical protein [Oceanipulchritudo sp.]
LEVMSGDNDIVGPIFHDVFVLFFVVSLLCVPLCVLAPGNRVFQEIAGLGAKQGAFYILNRHRPRANVP